MNEFGVSFHSRRQCRANFNEVALNVVRLHLQLVCFYKCILGFRKKGKTKLPNFALYFDCNSSIRSELSSLSLMSESNFSE